MKVQVGLRKCSHYFVALILLASVGVRAETNGESTELAALNFVSHYASCIDHMGLPDAEIRGDVSMLSVHKKRLKKYQKKRKRRIEKLSGLLTNSDFATDLLAQRSLVDVKSKLTGKEKKIIREIVRVSDNLYKKELKLYGLLAGWGYSGKDMPSLSLWSCHMIAAREKLPEKVELSLDAQDTIKVAALTPVAKGVFALSGSMTNRNVSKEVIKTYGSDVLSRLRLISDQCEISAELAQKGDFFAEDQYFLAAKEVLCGLTGEDAFKLAWEKSHRFYQLGLQLHSQGIEKVERNSEYSALHKEIHSSVFGGSLSKKVDQDVARQNAVANLKVALYRELANGCSELPCGLTYSVAINAIKRLAIAEEQKNTKFFFPI